jgi:hypothetical protein
VVLIASLLIPTAAVASCVGPAPVPQAIEGSPAVFVGTVVEVENSDRWAMVAVEEVWKGEDVPSVVELRAGPKDPPGGGGVATSNDRYYEEGARYIFFPYRRADAVFRDSACTRTSELPSRVERFRPADASAPVADVPPEPVPEDPDPPPDNEEGLAADDTDGSEGIPAWTVLGAAIIALGALGALATWRFRRRPPGAEHPKSPGD